MRFDNGKHPFEEIFNVAESFLGSVLTDVTDTKGFDPRGFDPSDLISKTIMRADIKEFTEKFVVDVEIPGFTKEEIEIEYSNDFLKIKADKQHEDHVEGLEEEIEEVVFIRKERFITKLSRSFNIPSIEESGIEAVFENGVLSVTLPKKKKDENKKTIIIK